MSRFQANVIDFTSFMLLFSSSSFGPPSHIYSFSILRSFSFPCPLIYMVLSLPMLMACNGGDLERRATSINLTIIYFPNSLPGPWLVK